ncbi:MAG: hypothetical protein ABIU29_07465 [Chthoniobacterales bacterium]
MKAAKQVYLLVDSSKWDQTGFIKVVQLDEIGVVITDNPIHARTLGVKVISGLSLHASHFHALWALRAEELGLKFFCSVMSV